MSENERDFYNSASQPQQAGENLFNTADYNVAVEKTAQTFADQRRNSGGLLAMGILSIIFCALNFYVPYVHWAGITLGIVAVAMAAPRLKLRMPMNMGAFVCGIIGISLGIVDIILGIVIWSAFA